MTMLGKWSQPGVPHKGWRCVSVDDLGSPDAICAMCETQEIRYVHYMQHTSFHEVLGVGCVCAARMEDDYEAPDRRERALRNAAQRRRRWLERNWSTSARGNSYLNTDGLNITVFQRTPTLWGARIVDRATDQSRTSKGRYATEDAAKLAVFDTMIFLKEQRGWGR